ncbi:MAG TPA: hypothetical protein VN631_18795, partial [Negativicutes bacterium]|nr:hypothetical protein [Negativicutes bacterium]
CHVGATSQMYVAPGDLRTPEADDLYHRTAPIADMVREYMTAISSAARFTSASSRSAPDEAASVKPQKTP